MLVYVGGDSNRLKCYLMDEAPSRQREVRGAASARVVSRSSGQTILLSNVTYCTSIIILKCGCWLGF